MAEIVIPEFIHAAALAPLEARFRVHHDPALVDARAALEAAVGEARALIVRNRTRVDAALIAAAPRLEVVGRLGVGLDNIDLAACRARRIAVIPATGLNAPSVAEFVIAGLLLLFRGAFQETGAVLAGDWPREGLIGREVQGKRLGLLGFGAIAREVARRAVAMGMTVTAHDPYVPAGDPAWRELGVAKADFEAILGESDALSLHLPLTPETRGLLDGAALERLRPGAYLINTARGGLVDEAALAAALGKGALGGALLDVFAEEPLRRTGHLRDAPNLILTPHIAGVTVESNDRVSSYIVARVLEALSAGGGSPP